MRPRKPWHYKEILEGMYLEQNLTLRQIAQILDTTASNILYWMKKFSIDTREFDIGCVHKGKALSESQKQYLSDLARKRFADPGNHPMTGHKHSEESKRQMSETKKRKRQEQEDK